jgi:hypothetical protein
MYKDCLHKGDRMRNVHNIQEANTMEYVGISPQSVIIIMT